MIYDPFNVNLAMNDDCSLMRRVVVEDLGQSPVVSAQQFVPMDEVKDFTRPEW